MTILSVNHVQITIPIGEEAAARAFYCNLLGLPEIPKPQVLMANGGFWLGLSGGFQVHVGVETGFERTTTKAHVAYEVKDIEHWREKLIGAGFTVKSNTPIPGFTRIEFRDPFGNRVEFIQRV
jgi:catechol 2,3-dioxygenase-like lactoylglutathione lyase family enzyme